MRESGYYEHCGRCHQRLEANEEYNDRPARVKGGFIVLCDDCNRDEVYGHIVHKAGQVVLRVLEEGENKYPDIDFKSIVDKPDNIEHALEHLASLSDPTEDHLGHALTRCLLEILRRELV